jgi:hypothetical protein
VGQTLTVDITSLGGSGTILYQWRRDAATDIPAANASTYLLTPADVNHAITARVSRAGNSGSVESAPTDPVTAQNTIATLDSISVDGGSVTWNPPFDPETVNYTLTIPATVSSLTLTGTVPEDSNALITTTPHPLSVSKGDSAKTITVKSEDALVTRTYTLNLVWLEPIAFTDLKDETIDLSAAGHELSWADNTELSVTVAGFDEFQWYVDGAPVSSGATLIKHARDFSVARHTLSVRVKKGNNTYSKTIYFMVVTGL